LSSARLKSIETTLEIGLPLANREKNSVTTRSVGIGTLPQQFHLIRRGPKSRDHQGFFQRLHEKKYYYEAQDREQLDLTVPKGKDPWSYFGNIIAHKALDIF